jgi:hypothetical protein
MFRLLEKIDLTAMAGNILADNTDKVKDLNIRQLMQGLNRYGQPLSPKYSEDPYFKKPGAWQRYAAWKKKLFPETPYDRPNLIIIGTYHDSIQVNRQAQVINFRGTASFSNSVDQKYNDAQLGLSDESKAELWREVIKPPLVDEFCRQTGAKKG